MVKTTDAFATASCGDAAMLGVITFERFRFAAITIPERDVVAVLKKQTGDGRAHLAEAEES